MTRSGKSLLLAGALLASAGSAYAADPLQAPQLTQQSYTTGSVVPAAPAAPTAGQTNSDHFAPPPGYYQNQKMVPYTSPNYGPKPN